MASYKRVVLTEKDNMISEKSNAKPIMQNTSVKKHMDKFNNSYAVDKLNELYEEFDAITINSPTVSTISETVSEVKTNSAVSVKAKIYLTSAILTLALLAFLAIFNIFVINGLGSGINMLQQEVASTEYNVKNLYDAYKNLKNVSKLEDRIKASGYVELPVNSLNDISLIETVEPAQFVADTNWFNQFCDFIAGLLGS